METTNWIFCYFWCYVCIKIINLFKKAIDLLSEINLTPKLVICDQGPNNRGCATLLNINSDKPYFIYNCHEIYFMFDPPHLLKSIRNGLETGYSFDGNIVKMKHIEDFYNIKTKLNLPLGKSYLKYIIINKYINLIYYYICDPCDIYNLLIISYTSFSSKN